MSEQVQLFFEALNVFFTGPQQKRVIETLSKWQFDMPTDEEFAIAERAGVAGEDAMDNFFQVFADEFALAIDPLFNPRLGSVAEETVNARQDFYQLTRYLSSEAVVEILARVDAL